LDEADLYPLEVLMQPVVVEREGAREIRSSREGDQSDPISGTRLDEFLDDDTRDVEPARRLAAELEVERAHRAGDVDCQHDVDPAGLDLAGAEALLRPRERDDEERRNEDAKPRPRAPRASPPRSSQAAQQLGGRVEERGGPSDTAGGEEEQRQKGEEPEQLRVRESHVRVSPALGRVSSTKRSAVPRSASISGSVSGWRANL